MKKKINPFIQTKEKPRLISKIDVSDIFLIIGLLAISSGLYIWFGLGIALTVPGAIMILLSILWNLR